VAQRLKSSWNASAISRGSVTTVTGRGFVWRLEPDLIYAEHLPSSRIETAQTISPQADPIILLTPTPLPISPAAASWVMAYLVTPGERSRWPIIKVALPASRSSAVRERWQSEDALKTKPGEQANGSDERQKLSEPEAFRTCNTSRRTEQLGESAAVILRPENSCSRRQRHPNLQSHSPRSTGTKVDVRRPRETRYSVGTLPAFVRSPATRGRGNVVDDLHRIAASCHLEDEVRPFRRTGGRQVRRGPASGERGDQQPVSVERRRAIGEGRRKSLSKCSLSKAPLAEAARPAGDFPGSIWVSTSLLGRARSYLGSVTGI